MKSTDEDRFLKRVTITDSCWQWDALRPDGYGAFMAGGTQGMAHRWAYQHYTGPIPDDLVVDHLCRNRGCVNPDHMELVSRGENVARGTSPSAMQAKQELCPRGHTYTRKYGNRRYCQPCQNERRKAAHSAIR